MARRPGRRRRPRAPDVAGLRAKRARPGRDRSAGRRPGRVALGPCPHPRRERPGAPPAHHRAGRPSAGAPPPADRRSGVARRARARAAGSRLRARGGGRRPRRVRPPRRHPRHLPAVRAAPDPARVLRRRDRLGASVRPRRSAHRPLDGRRRAPAGQRVPAAGRRRCHDPRAPRAAGDAPERAARGGPRALRLRRRTTGRPHDGRCTGHASRHGSRRPHHACPSRRRRRGGVGPVPVAGDRARPRRPWDPARAGRARRPGGSGRVPVAPGGRAAVGPRRVGGAAEGLAVDLPAAPRLEGQAGGRPNTRADVGVRRAGRDGRQGALVRRPLRLARAATATRPDGQAGRDGRGLAVRWRAGRPRV